MQGGREVADAAEVNQLLSSTIKVGPHPDRLEGTYRNRPAQFAIWVGCIAVLALVVLALVVSPSRSLAMSGAGVLVAAAAVVTAFVVGRRGVRPRFEVTPEGVCVVNPAQTRSLTWAQIEAFDCAETLVVRTGGHDDVAVNALPTRSWGGPVATLADRLNARLDEARAPVEALPAQ